MSEDGRGFSVRVFRAPRARHWLTGADHRNFGCVTICAYVRRRPATNGLLRTDCVGRPAYDSTTTEPQRPFCFPKDQNRAAACVNKRGEVGCERGEKGERGEGGKRGERLDHILTYCLVRNSPSPVLKPALSYAETHGPLQVSSQRGSAYTKRTQKNPLGMTGHSIDRIFSH
ncbi:hypothetical protein CGRA01v4_06340 [Colletotrichum graminicola]|nr:hypothetical protein CGRA01v4_06340 [Colletotrichum graminicola]